MLTVLLGEAPKRMDGFAFDADSWTTHQLVDVLGVDNYDLNKVFYVLNVFEYPQWTRRDGFDRFNLERAADEIDRIDFPSQRVICLGKRVTKAMEWALDLRFDSIPENAFRRFDRTARGSGWHLARIPHPSGLWDRGDREGLVLPEETRAFLRTAAGLRLLRRG
jgi:hypothetical protein